MHFLVRDNGCDPSPPIALTVLRNQRELSRRVSDVLDLLDQTAFDVERATGASNLLQCFWVYNRPLDIAGLRQLHDRLQRGRLLSRRIARSPLPFGRHRWVSSNRLPEFVIVASAQPRNKLNAWLNEQPTTPLDVEHGPGWDLAVLPFTDGGAAVSLVISHCLTDGVGLCEALTDAASGRGDAVGWTAADSRRRWRALCEDMRQTARDSVEIGRAVIATARSIRHNRNHAESAPSAAGPDRRITIPRATIFVDAEEWDARAHSLGGTSNALLAGYAARLAQRVGRVTADGSVTLTMPVNERGPGDTRAGAITEVDITVDAAPATTDLREIRATIKQALMGRRDGPDQLWAMFPVVPLLPQWLIRRMVSGVYGSATRVVSSNLGDVNPAVNRPDGTDADYFAMTWLYPGATTAMMHRAGGLLALLSGRVHGQVFISALAYQPGNSNDDLPLALSSTLNEFSLTAARL